MQNYICECNIHVVMSSGNKFRLILAVFDAADKERRRSVINILSTL